MPVRTTSPGKERDTESGNDYFGARYYGSSMGRFLSPDPVFISAQRLMDPQSINLYSYVRNNPLGLTDDSGLDFYLACQTSDHSGCGQVQNGSSSVWVQGQGSGKDFQAFDVDMNKQGDPSAGYRTGWPASDLCRKIGCPISGSFIARCGIIRAKLEPLQSSIVPSKQTPGPGREDPGPLFGSIPGSQSLECDGGYESCCHLALRNRAARRCLHSVASGEVAAQVGRVNDGVIVGRERPHACPFSRVVVATEYPYQVVRTDRHGWRTDRRAIDASSVAGSNRVAVHRRRSNIGKLCDHETRYP
ncbi:MAG: RHS repeat-associated core domain-containing protein [Acidobacteria bacterium]|nr:RHS repeat-associated core domain-containing protein [Acidobacteriota bacterium]